jgi:hypothetical protein
MGRLVLTAFFCLLSVLIARPQTPSIKWGTGVRFSRNETLGEFYPLMGGEAGWLRLKYPTLGYHKAILDVFDLSTLQVDRSLELHHGKTIQERYRFYRPRFSGLALQQHRFLVFQTGYDPNRKQALALINPMDEEGREEEKPQIILDDRIESKLKAPSVRFVSDSAAGRVGLFLAKAAEKQLGVEVEVRVVDSTLQLEWANKAMLPFQRTELGPEEIKMNAQGVMWVLTQIRPRDTNPFANRDEKRYFQLFSFSPDDSSGQFGSHTLQYGDRKIMGASLDTTQGEIWLYMTYEIPQKKAAAVSGILLQPLPLDPEDPWPKSIDLPFDPTFIPDFQTDALVQSRADKEAAFVEVLRVFSSARGDKFVLAEHRLNTEHCYTDYRTAQQFCTYTHYRNDVFVFALDSLHRLAWNMKLPKRQISRNDNGMFLSVLGALINDTLKLAWLEHPETTELTSEKELRFMDNPRKANLITWKLSATGRPERHQFPLPKQGRFAVVPMLNKGLVLSDGAIFLSGVNRRKVLPGLLSW